MSSREKILNAVRQAVQVPSELPDLPKGTDERIRESLEGITPKDTTGLIEQFRTELEAVSGEYIQVQNQQELVNAVVKDIRDNQYDSLSTAGNGESTEIAEHIKKQMPDLQILKADDIAPDTRKAEIAKSRTALVEVAYGVADVASLALLFADVPSTLPYYLPDVTYVILRPQQLVANLFELFEKLPRDKAKNMVLITGPSRTADIEKVLILGAHGPRRLLVFMLND